MPKKRKQPEQPEVIDLTQEVQITKRVTFAVPEVQCERVTSDMDLDLPEVQCERIVEVKETIDDVIHFKSGSGKTSWLSNFYATKVNVDGYAFPSSEHAYQCLRNEPGNKDWMVGGKYSSYDTLLEFMEPFSTGKKGASAFSSHYSIKVVPEDKRAAKVQYWKKKNAIGIVAKTAHKKLRNQGESNTTDYSKEEQWTIFWHKILRAKFNRPEMKAKLYKTGNAILIEAGYRLKNKPESAWAASPWSGGYDKATNRCYGLNWMGDFIMRIRHELFPEIPYVPWDTLLQEYK